MILIIKHVPAEQILPRNKYVRSCRW
ncbi:unnamed protein product [Tuber melanosporum]|uniref:(Perigord truffle) hypothetical protein n=1 Tax=Tuber melanosporum (strain Mel28) TaxID=656061 RepID=D5G5T2_TUBMM|nr:unnamed protein product [Tuber melanosporum]